MKIKVYTVPTRLLKMFQKKKCQEECNRKYGENCLSAKSPLDDNECIMKVQLDWKVLENVSWDKCEKECRYNSECSAFIHTNDKCYLKNYEWNQDQHMRSAQGHEQTDLYVKESTRGNYKMHSILKEIRKTKTG